MIQTTDLSTEKLRKLIDKLPPGRARKKYEVALGGLLCKEGEAQGILENSIIQAVKMYSYVLEDDIWLILDSSFIPSDSLGCYYAEEIALLKDKSPEDLREIHKYKLAFPGARLLQERAN